MEGVPLASGRAFGAIAVLVIWALLIFWEPVQALIHLAGHGALPPEPDFTRTEIAILLWVTVFFTGPLLVGPLLGYVALVRPRRNVLLELGLRVDRHTPKELLIGLGLGAGIWLVLIGIFVALDALGAPDEPTSQFVLDWLPVLRQQPILILLIPISAGLFEEVAFRGFLQPRIGILLSSLAFGLVHISYGTYLQLIVPALLGIALAFVYAWRKVLWAPVAAHFMLDFIQLSLGAMFVTEAP